MNATERARRSDSLYYDTSVTNRRALCDMIANLESDLEDQEGYDQMLRDRLRQQTELHVKAEDENAKLRERANNLFNAVFAKNNELIDLLCKNEKLRELVRDMGELLDVLTECDLACKHYRDGCIGDCYYVNARRELGVEVDDG